MDYGKRVWLVADGYWDSHSNGLYPSHESLCVLNTTHQDAQLTLTIFFEDAPPREGFRAECPAQRTHHVRLDRLRDAHGAALPQDTPYAMLLECNVPVVVQYSRLMSSQPELGLMTTMAWPVED